MKTKVYTTGWRISVAFSFVLLWSAGSFSLFAWGQEPLGPQPTAGEPVRVSVDAFAGNRPVGHLGVPLGTVVRVTGVVVDGGKLQSKKYAGKTLLRIAEVNGKELNPPIDFVFERAAKDVRKPEFGERFDYYVHEYGHFDGVVTPPKESGLPIPDFAHDGFYYRRYVTVHKSFQVEK